MTKKILSIALISALGVGFSGCLNENKISCNDTTVQSVIQEILTPSISEKIFLQKYNNGDFGKPIPYFTAVLNSNFGGIRNYSKIAAGSNDKAAGIAVAEEFVKFDNNFNINKFLLNRFRTINENKDSSKVECSALVNTVFQNEEYNFNINYIAQLTDNEKEVYVEITSFE